MSDRRLGRLARAAGSAGAGTMLSRVAGALRDVAIGHVFGAGRAADVFWIAFTIPNVFRRFVADEGLTGVVIPALDRAEEEEGEEPARRLAGATLAFLLLVCLGLCVLGILAAPWVVRAFAWGFSADPDKLALTVALTRWLFPFLLFVCLVSYCEGLLNRRDHYFVPKLAPGLVSCCIVAAALLLAHRQEEPLFALVVGVLVGGAVHLLVCLPPLISRWGLPRPLLSAMRGPRFARFVVEMGKVVLIGVFGQLNIMALRTLASLLPEGSVTHYWFANRVVDLAQGVVAVSVGSALMRVLSQAATRRDWPAFAEHFGDAVRLLGVVLLPAACLLVVLAEPAVSLLFRHGEFDAAAVGRQVKIPAPPRRGNPHRRRAAGRGLPKRNAHLRERFARGGYSIVPWRAGEYGPQRGRSGTKGLRGIRAAALGKASPARSGVPGASGRAVRPGPDAGGVSAAWRCPRGRGRGPGNADRRLGWRAARPAADAPEALAVRDPVQPVPQASLLAVAKAPAGAPGRPAAPGRAWR